MERYVCVCMCVYREEERERENIAYVGSTCAFSSENNTIMIV